MPDARISGRSPYLDEEVLQRVCKLSDFVALFGTSLVTGILGHPSPQTADQAGALGLAAALLAFLCIFLLRSFGLYRLKRLNQGTNAFFVSAAIVILCGFGMFSFLQWRLVPVPIELHVDWALAIALYLLVTRASLQMWARPLAEQGRFRKRVAIVGGGQAAERAITLIESSRDLDVDIIGIFDDRSDERTPDRKVGSIADLHPYAREHRLDLIVVAIPLAAEQRLLGILKRLWELPVDIRISATASSLEFSAKAYTKLGDLPLLPVFDRPLKGWGLFLKSVLERLLAGIGIVLLAPVMLAVAAAVKYESKGPIIFRQKRYGFNNELIEVYKFRSMYAEQSDQSAAKLVTKEDPRVTRVGRVIRKASLDELPQLFNVVAGQLSLVGPRPHATQAKAAETLYENVVDGYFARHKVRPGITGWAQINGWRGETDTREKLEQRVKHDLEYIDRWSLLLDLKIIARTPMALLKGENAY
jgi:Undecaprenyl-phosphate glucose phosphotransferase